MKVEELRWHEWLNRDFAVAAPLRREVEKLVGVSEHQGLVDRLRDMRPRGEQDSFKGIKFWGQIANRAALVLALLTRPTTISAFQRRAGLPVAKLYTYLREWHVHFRSFDRSPKASVLGNILVEGHLHFENNAYFLRTSTRTYPVRYSSYGEWVFTKEPIDDLTFTHVRVLDRLWNKHFNLADVPFADRLWREKEVREDLDRLSHKLTGFAVVPHPTVSGEYLIPREVLETLYGKELVQAALRKLNLCHCRYWNDTKMTCGIHELRSPCDDYLSLELDQ